MSAVSRFEMAKTSPPTERWQSVDAVAEHLGVARDTIYRWIEQKRLPANRVGRLWKFKLSEVDAWVKAGGAVESTAVFQQTSSAGRPRVAGGSGRVR
jgi:excisionase family DNA binding protein